MPRIQSPATQVRHIKRELKAATAEGQAAREELVKRRLVGALMSNICFNLGQESATWPTPGSDGAERAKMLMREMRAAWDAIPRTRT